jgi:hypothetical protein
MASVEESLEIVSQQKLIQSDIAREQLSFLGEQTKILQVQVDAYVQHMRKAQKIYKIFSVFVALALLYLVFGKYFDFIVRDVYYRKIFIQTSDKTLCETALEKNNYAVLGYEWNEYSQETDEARRRNLTIRTCIEKIGKAVN